MWAVFDHILGVFWPNVAVLIRGCFDLIPYQHTVLTKQNYDWTVWDSLSSLTTNLHLYQEQNCCLFRIYKEQPGVWERQLSYLSSGGGIYMPYMVMLQRSSLQHYGNLCFVSTGNLWEIQVFGLCPFMEYLDLFARWSMNNAWNVACLSFYEVLYTLYGHISGNLPQVLFCYSLISVHGITHIMTQISWDSLPWNMLHSGFYYLCSLISLCFHILNNYSGAHNHQVEHKRQINIDTHL